MCVVLHACLLDGSVHHRHCFVVWFQKPGFTLVLLYHRFVLFYWPFFCTSCPSGFCSACKPWHSLFSAPQMSGYSRPSHAVFLLVLFVCSCTHTYAHKAPHLHPLMPFSAFSPFLHSGLLPKDKESGVSTSSGVCVWGGVKRSTLVSHGFLWFCCYELNSLHSLALQLNDSQPHDMLHRVRQKVIQSYKLQSVAIASICTDFMDLRGLISFQCCATLVYHCAFSVVFTKKFEITCVQHRAASVFWLCCFLFISALDNLVFLQFFFLFFLLLEQNLQMNLFLRCVKKAISYCAMSNC